MDHNSLDLIIRNRESVLFQGKVVSITSYNDKGKFDILPEHANFISLLSKDIMYRTSNNKENTIPLSNGIIKVNENKVEIFLGIGE
jgi:F0F1-type ATP synthase epsilon subunit